MRIIKWVVKDSLCVFLYHDVLNQPSEFSRKYDLNVPPALFEEQIRIIRHHFTIISPLQLLQGGFPTPAALITFDDGLAGCFENALPILEHIQCPSMVFMNMAPVNGEVFWSGLLTYLFENDAFKLYLKKQRGYIPRSFLACSREDVEGYLNTINRDDLFAVVRKFYGAFATHNHLKAFEKSQYVSLGNHLYNHYNALSLSDSDLKKAYLENQRALSCYSNSMEIFSYPFGQPATCFNRSTHQVVRSLGAHYAFTSFPGINLSLNKWIVNRIPMGQKVKSEPDFMKLLSTVALRSPARKLKSIIKKYGFA